MPELPFGRIGYTDGLTDGQTMSNTIVADRLLAAEANNNMQFNAS